MRHHPWLEDDDDCQEEGIDLVPQRPTRVPENPCETACHLPEAMEYRERRLVTVRGDLVVRMMVVVVVLQGAWGALLAHRRRPLVWEGEGDSRGHYCFPVDCSIQRSS